MKKHKIGLLGFGSLGQFIYHTISSEKYEDEYEVVFVWNRSKDKLDESNIPASVRLPEGKLDKSLEEFLQKNEVDIIFEAAHPDVVRATFRVAIQYCDYLPTSLSAWANTEFEDHAIHELKQSGNRLFIPAGASWGIVDIKRLSDVARLEELSVKMTFGADALKVTGEIADNLQEFIGSIEEEACIAHGSVRKIAINAPQNTNTMVGIALAAHELDLDGVYGELWASKVRNEHIVEIELRDESGMRIRCVRSNPARKGAVTGDSTFFSFLSSLLRSREEASDIRFC